MAPRSEFNQEFFKKFYWKDQVHSRRKIEHLAGAVHNLCRWWDVSVRSVLDIGSGVGYWRDWYLRNHPKTRVLSVDVSEHACQKYGHDCRDIGTWQPKGQFDLVVCQSVLQYLNNRSAIQAICNIGSATGHVLYLEVPTIHDLRVNIDPQATDLEIFSRSGDWYRRHLSKFFRPAGAGLWVAKSSSIVLFELEAKA